jgi:hypothetical protein
MPSVAYMGVRTPHRANGVQDGSPTNAYCSAPQARIGKLPLRLFGSKMVGSEGDSVPLRYKADVAS